MVNCTCTIGAFNECAMSGSDGRYMSIDSGPSAVRNDNNKVSAKEPGASIGNDVRKISASIAPDRGAECSEEGHFGQSTRPVLLFGRRLA